LMLSCFAGQTHVVRVLLAHGADTNLQTKDGITALMMSSYNGHTAVTELLLYYGADMNTVTSIGMTALRLSTDNGHKSVTKLLIEHSGRENKSSSNFAGRKRQLCEQEATFTVVVTQNFKGLKFQAKEEKIEQILKTLLQLQGQAADAECSSPPSAMCVELREKPTLREAYRILCPLAFNWQNIGILLGIDNNTLKKIKYDCGSVADDCLREMLDKWLVRADPTPTWGELAEAVEGTDQTVACKIRTM